MSIILTVVANDSQAESNWVAELKATLGATQDIGVESFLTTQKHGQVVFVDSAHRSLDQVLDKLDRRGRAVFLLVNSGDHIPKALSEGRVDDVLVGNAVPEAEQGLQFGRIISARALGFDVPGATVNRYCASGLETIAMATAKIRMGMADCIIAGGWRV